MCIEEYSNSLKKENIFNFVYIPGNDYRKIIQKKIT